MNTTRFLHSDLAMYTRPGRTYARVGVRDPARMYIRGRIFWHVAVCTGTRFRRDCLNWYVGGSTTTRVASCSATVHHCRETDRQVCTYTFATTLRTLRPGGSQLSGRIRRHFFACEDIAGGSQLSGGGVIFLRVIWRHFLACKDVAGGSIYQPHRVHYSSDGCCLLTTLTMPCEQHPCGGRWRGLGRARH